MVIIIQDPGFFLNYVIVHCNLTCSVGVTRSQDLNQSANYKDGISPHLLSLKYFLPSSGFSFHNCGTFLLTSSLRAICVDGEEVGGAVGRGLLPCRGVRRCRQSRSRGEAMAPHWPLRKQQEWGQGLRGRDLAKHLLFSFPFLHITICKSYKMLSHLHIFIF